LNVKHYEIAYYPPDGHGTPVDKPPAIDGQRFATVAEARVAIREHLRGKDYGLWSGTDDDIEAWHESNEDGCGGFAIRKTE
jgi:hypothetical protein